MKKRLTSWVFWSSLAAQILSLLVASGIISVSASETISGAVVSVLQIFVLFGVLNNPSDHSAF